MLSLKTTHNPQPLPCRQISFGKKQAEHAGLVRQAGPFRFCRSAARCATGQKLGSPWFWLIVRKGHVRQRSISARLAFLVLLWRRQKNKVKRTKSKVRWVSLAACRSMEWLSPLTQTLPQPFPNTGYICFFAETKPRPASN